MDPAPGGRQGLGPRDRAMTTYPKTSAAINISCPCGGITHHSATTRTDYYLAPATTATTLYVKKNKK